MNRFENGFDSFKRSIKNLTKDNMDEFDLKEVIIHFHHSIEILFKYILFGKNRWCIYNYNNNESIEKNKNQLFTITFNETIEKIKEICEEKIDKYTYNRIKNLNEYRNSLIHDELDLIKEEVNQLIISILPTVIMILQNHLPEESKEEFIKFINDEEVVQKLNNLYANNDKWRLITIVNLLTAYESCDYSKQALRYDKNINKMLLLLGCKIREDEILTNIDDSYYLLTASYLKKQVWNYIVFHSEEIKKYINDDEMKKLLEKNEVISNSCKKSIYNMVCHLMEITNISGEELISLRKDARSVDSLFNSFSLLNKVDIYDILFYIMKTAQSYLQICHKNKRREKFLKEILLYDDKKISVYDIYSCFLEWFKKTKWYNKINFKELSEDIMNVFIEYKSSCDGQVINTINDIDILDDLSGKLDNIESIKKINIEEIDIIIEHVNKSKCYTLILDASVLLRTYSDNKYNNRTEQTYIAVSGSIIQENKFSVDNVEYLGYKMSLDRLVSDF